MKYVTYAPFVQKKNFHTWLVWFAKGGGIINIIGNFWTNKKSKKGNNAIAENMINKKDK